MNENETMPEKRSHINIIKKIIHILMAVFLLTLPIQPCFTYNAFAGIATDTLTVKVGYQGGPFLTKATYSWKDLDDAYGGALSSHKVVYSYYSGSRSDRSTGRNVIVSARGFYISDLLEYAGIDLSSISGFEFYTDDQKVGAFTTMTKRELLDSARYYYPNMGVDDFGKQIALDGGDISAGKTRVQSMFALEDNWEWDGVAENFTSMSPTGRFHLLFGQTDVTESRTSQAAKYVHTINVIFSGAPVIGTESNIELKVGTDYRVQVNITAADTELENYIRENLVWSSNNTDIVEVDQYGNLKIKGDGTATITAVSGNTSGSVSITTGNGNGTGTGADVQGEGSGNRQSAGGMESSAHENTEASAEDETKVSYSENSKGVYILSRDFMERSENAEWVNSILKKAPAHDSETGSVMNRREKAMDEDAKQLVVEERKAVPLRYVAAGTAVVFLLGIMYGPFIYKRNLKGGGIRLLNGAAARRHKHKIA